jgi:hypothetical protein
MRVEKGDRVLIEAYVLTSEGSTTTTVTAINSAGFGKDTPFKDNINSQSFIIFNHHIKEIVEYADNEIKVGHTVKRNDFGKLYTGYLEGKVMSITEGHATVKFSDGSWWVNETSKFDRIRK